MKNKFLVVIVLIVVVYFIYHFVINQGVSRYQKAYSETYINSLHGHVGYAEESKGSVFFSVNNDTNEYLLCEPKMGINSKEINSGMRVDKDSCSFEIIINDIKYNFKLDHELYKTPKCPN